MDLKLDTNTNLFIVYRYNINSSNSTKYIMGIYPTREQAIQRQKEIGSTFNKICNTYTSNNGDVLFVNKLKLGDSNIEMFTT
jgi:hypothetical protein